MSGPALPAGASLGLGHVMHHRLQPVAHRFTYPVFFCLLPLHALPASSLLFGINRARPFSFRDADHGARDGSPLLPWVRGLLREHGLPADGPVWLQTFPRMFGYVFNPVSFWFCHDQAGALVAVLAEVNSTFGERHCYLVAHADGRPITDDDVFSCPKVLHVSPFFPVSGRYSFRFHRRGGRLRVAVDYAAAEGQGDSLRTRLSGRLQPLGDGRLVRILVAYPWQTLGVMLRIHWQAARLFFGKRLPFFRKPDAPPRTATTTAH